MRWATVAVAILGIGGLMGCDSTDPSHELLNVSYDPTRELYRKLNRAFVEQYERETGIRLRIRQSHGGSGSQARAVVDGLQADVLTLAMWPDFDVVARKGFMAADWDRQLPTPQHPYPPYFSTIVLVVRKGNPHGIRDWNDLRNPQVKIVWPNPKTSGGAKLAFLAAWGAVLRSGGSEADARAFVADLYRRTPVLDSGARGATITFSRKNIGDVQITWENEAILESRELGDAVEIIYPKRSIRAQPYVAIVDANVDRKGTRTHALRYLQFLYTEPAQRIIAEEGFRPAHPKVAEELAERFPPIDDLFDITAIVPEGYDHAQRRFFSDGAEFDRMFDR